MGYIPKEGLENLRKYRYNGVDKSLLSKYVLTPYWNKLVKLWSTTIAPNVITFTGLACVFLNFLTLLYYDPYYLAAKEGPGLPRWVYISWAAGLFAYQSFDAIDGKHARRTQMAGPLGELFDHGCDALNTTLEVILTCHALNFGQSWWTVAAQFAALANFYLTTWEEFHTGQLYLGVFSGPVEGILMVVVIYLITGFNGPAFWDQGIWTFLRLEGSTSLTEIIPNIPLNETFMLFGGIGLGLNIIISFIHVARMTLRTSPLALLRPISRLLPFFITTFLHLSWLTASTPSGTTILHSPLLIPFLCSWGLQFAHQVSHIILAHLTKAKSMPFWDPLWIVILLAVLDAHALNLFERKTFTIFGWRYNPPLVQHSPDHVTSVVYTTLVLSLTIYARFCYLVINDITEFLGIACFTVRKRGADGAWHNSAPISENVSTMGGSLRRTKD